MSNKHFDDILRKSMETPRNLPFDEGAWARMEDSLPVQSSAWSGWLKFLPFVAGIVGLLIWNINLQRQLNHLSQKSIETKIENSPLLQQPTKVIHKTDTVYEVKVVENQITEKQVKAYVEKYLSQANVSHTQINPLYNPTNSFIAPSSSLMTPNNHFDRPSLLNGDGQNDTPIFDNKKEDGQKPTENPIDTNVFAINDNQIPIVIGTSSIAEVNSEEYQTDLTVTEDKNITVNEVLTVMQGELQELASIPMTNVKHYMNLSLQDRLDNVSLHRPKKPEEKLRERLYFDEYRLGLTTAPSTTVSSITGIINVGVNARSYILPNISLHLDVMSGNSYFTGFTASSNQDFYPNPYPYLEPEQIPVDHTLESVNVDLSYIQAGLSLRKIWYKDEHIRPFVEVGWQPYYERSGSVSYMYSMEEDGVYSFTSPESILLTNENFDFKWNFTPVSFGTGLSSTFFNRRVELDVGLKCITNFNNRRSLFHTGANTSIGLNMSLGYCF